MNLSSSGIFCNISVHNLFEQAQGISVDQWPQWISKVMTENKM